jgi:hypothetical protein
MIMQFDDFYQEQRKKWIRKRKQLAKQKESEGSITGLDDSAANN